jgi:hypothetical protein
LTQALNVLLVVDGVSNELFARQFALPIVIHQMEQLGQELAGQARTGRGGIVCKCHKIFGSAASLLLIVEQHPCHSDLFHLFATAQKQ